MNKRITKRKLIAMNEYQIKRAEYQSRFDGLVGTFGLAHGVAHRLASDIKLFTYFMDAQNLIVLQARRDMLAFIERQTIQLAQDITK